MNSYDTRPADQDPDSFDVRASLLRTFEATKYHWVLVTSTCVLTVALVTLYAFVWPPVYEANAVMMVERDVDPVRDGFYVGWNVFRKDDARTEIEMMTAGPILRAVVEREGLTFDDVYHPFMSHLTHLWGQSLVGRSYRGLKKRLFPPPPDAPSEEDLALGKTIVNMRAGMSIAPVAESNVGRLSVKGPSRRVANIANALLDVYMERRTERHFLEAERSYVILTDQVAGAGAELDAIAQRRLRFETENALVFDFQKEALEITRLADLEEVVDNTRTRIASVEAGLTEVERQLSLDAPVVTSERIREAIILKRLDVETTLISARTRYRADAPEIQELERGLADVDALLERSRVPAQQGRSDSLNAVQLELVSKRNTMLTELAGARAALLTMSETAARLSQRLAQVPAMQTTLRSIDRDYALSQEKYKQLLAKQAQAAVSVATTKAAMPSMRVVEYAVPPADKSWPKLKYLYPIAVMVGLGFGVALALMLTHVSGRVRREHLELGGGSFPIYGTIGVSETPALTLLAPDASPAAGGSSSPA